MTTTSATITIRVVHIYLATRGEAKEFTHGRFLVRDTRLLPKFRHAPRQPPDDESEVESCCESEVSDQVVEVVELKSKRTREQTEEAVNEPENDLVVM